MTAVCYTVTSITHILPLFSTPHRALPRLHSFPTQRSSDLSNPELLRSRTAVAWVRGDGPKRRFEVVGEPPDLPLEEAVARSEEHMSELQSLRHLVCRLLLEKKKKKTRYFRTRAPNPTNEPI